MTAPLHDALAPDDDAFVRTAVRGLRVPQHHDDFWDVLHAELDVSADVMAAHGLLVEPEVAPLVVDLPTGAHLAAADEHLGRLARRVDEPADERGSSDGDERIEWNPAAAPPVRGPRPGADPPRSRRAPLRAAPAEGGPPPAGARPLDPVDPGPAPAASRASRSAGPGAPPAAGRPSRPAGRVPSAAAGRPPRSVAPGSTAAPATRSPAPVPGAGGWAEPGPAPSRRMGRPDPRAARRRPPAVDADAAAAVAARPGRRVAPDLDDRDDAVLPSDMRRRSNAVLVVVAAAAAIMALLAGLALVRQRAADGGTPSTSDPATVEEERPAEPAVELDDPIGAFPSD